MTYCAIVDGKVAGVAGFSSRVENPYPDVETVLTARPGVEVNAGEPVSNFRVEGTEIVERLHEYVPPPPPTEEDVERYRFNADRAAWEKQKVDACDEIRVKRLYDGFQYGDVHIRTDMVSIQNANGFMTFILAGANVFPIKWRTRENTDIFFNNIEEYSPFVGAISAYVKSCYDEEWAAKDGIRNSATFDDAWAAFVQYRDKQ